MNKRQQWLERKYIFRSSSRHVQQHQHPKSAHKVQKCSMSTTNSMYSISNKPKLRLKVVTNLYQGQSPTPITDNNSEQYNLKQHK